ncbi:conserved hypothetical protein [Parafrankia sp. EAN1pec]|uniref:DUF5719 family protein n=1 Tax=Parafrankia sp. (strain EAN1pec) TaxID=298653 RepID=UPI00015DA11B|nr:conserved hypothetical protein [Frankia sp. EAN1pec]
MKRIVVPAGVACLVGVVAALLTTAGPRPPAAVPRPVTAATLDCPDLGLRGQVPQLLDVVRGSGPDGVVRPSGGGALLGGDRQHDELLYLPRPDPGGPTPGGPAPGRTDLDGPDSGQSVARGPAGGPLRLVATGSAAAGLTATVTSPGSGAGPLRARCEQSRARTWFAGPATVAGRDPVLYWTNTGPRPARVSVGAVSSGQTAPRVEVTVPVGRTVSRRLAELAPEATVTTVDVDVHTGRVLSWMVDRASGSGPAAATPVPPTAGPATRVLLGGFLTPAGSGGTGAPAAGPPTADLVLSAPGAAATVRVSVITASGRHTPVGLEAVRIPAGAALRRLVTLTPASPSALLVESTDGGGIVAALGLPTGVAAAAPAAPGSGPPNGRTWVAGVVPERPRWAGVVVGDPGAAGPTPPGLVVAAAPVPAWTAGALVLVAPRRAATVWVDGRRFEVGAGRAVLAPLPAGRVGARVVGTGGPLVASQVLGTAPPSAGVVTALVPRTVSAVVPLTGAWRLRYGPASLADPRVAW